MVGSFYYFFIYVIMCFLEFVHTSDLESVNSLILKYCSKKISYGWLGMLIRSAIAAIDFNENINRKVKLDAAGEPRYKMKVISVQILIQILYEDASLLG